MPSTNCLGILFEPLSGNFAGSEKVYWQLARQLIQNDGQKNSQYDIPLWSFYFLCLDPLKETVSITLEWRCLKITFGTLHVHNIIIEYLLPLQVHMLLR